MLQPVFVIIFVQELYQDILPKELDPFRQKQRKSTKWKV